MPRLQDVLALQRAKAQKRRREALELFEPKKRRRVERALVDLDEAGWRVQPPPRTSKRNDILDEEVLRRSRAGGKVRDIAADLGIGAHVVEDIRRDYGFRSEWQGPTTAPNRKPLVVGEDGTVIRKWCPKCEEMLAAEEFWANATNPDGLQTACKSCQKAYRMARKSQRRAS